MKGGFRQIQGFGDPDCAKVIQAGLWLSDVVCFRLPSIGGLSNCLLTRHRFPYQAISDTGWTYSLVKDQAHASTWH